MTRRIFRSIVSVALLVLLACAALLLFVLYSYFGTVQAEQLQAELSFAAEGVETGGFNYLRALQSDRYRLTWVDAAGDVLFDSQGDAAQMENHAAREEIREAFQRGKGESTRFSDTLTEQTLYFAERLRDGSVLRISVSRKTTLSLLLALLAPLSAILFAAVLLSAALSAGISRRIVCPLEAINYERPLENDCYEELSPILVRMEQQRQQVHAQQAALEEQRREFAAITGRMREGLVLLNHRGEVLSINLAAERFFRTDADAVGRDFILVERSTELMDAIECAKREGDTELQLSRDGREYLLRVSGTAAEKQGIVLLLFDVTERVFAERNRREFTANVSHELKTPLQSIMGSAELLENGLVQAEDVPAFVGRIRREAGRLMSLIEDTIRLSQLDERTPLPVESVELRSLVSEELRLLRDAAAQKNISLELKGTEVHIQTVRQLLHEIVYNLCDNAIKYNVDGGSVTVTVGERFLSVRDSGIGIDAAQQTRIFERFYRVDKSHSRQIGGTGLGLSIVKHAVEYMNGVIEIKSEPGSGTEITVRFPEEN